MGKLILIIEKLVHNQSPPSCLSEKESYVCSTYPLRFVEIKLHSLRTARLVRIVLGIPA